MLTLGAFLVLSLAGQANTNLVATNFLSNDRSVAYTADGAVDAAIQQARYHGQCESFPKTGTLQLQTGLYVYVACAGTPMTVSVANGQSTITSSTPVFVRQDVGQSVFDKYLAYGTTITSYVSPTQANISGPPATGTDTGAIVGIAGQRLDAFWECASSSAITSCAPTSASVTAAVTFYDTDSNGNPGYYGYGMKIQSWVVSQANG